MLVFSQTPPFFLLEMKPPVFGRPHGSGYLFCDLKHSPGDVAGNCSTCL